MGCYQAANSTVIACLVKNITISPDFHLDLLSNRRVFAVLLQQLADVLVLVQNYFPWFSQLFGGYITAIGAILLNQIIDLSLIGLKTLLSCSLVSSLKQSLFPNNIF
ncbi:hypothetical protein AVEN_120701-1 [Araneus ventricosus]|uniref:Uncharacterized protein n=1 Tax=Araneus ventricosus TaxID=182803 RepID=A0A4Y2PDX1_ARAVE|nr:hypothetical protein AVEN_120701-1 [Araneus ventricosus]